MKNYCIRCVNICETIGYIKICCDGSYCLEENIEDATSFQYSSEAEIVCSYLDFIVKPDKRNYIYKILDKRKLTPNLAYFIEVNNYDDGYYEHFFIESNIDKGICVTHRIEYATTSSSIDWLVEKLKALLVLFPHWDLTIVEVDLNKKYRAEDNYKVVYPMEKDIRTKDVLGSLDF